MTLWLFHLPLTFQKGQSCQSFDLLNAVCLFGTTEPPDSLKLSVSIRTRFRFRFRFRIKVNFANEWDVFFFSLTRGWRLTCHTGWTTRAPMIRAVSTTTMKTPLLARAIQALTDTAPTSTMTIINTNQYLFFISAMFL